jgi:hypothetical protein
MRQQLGAAPSRTYDDVTKTYVDTADALRLQITNNLNDVANIATARTNLGLGTAATQTGPSSAIVGISDTQTLTNKTLTSPIISTIVNTNILTLPTSTDTLVGRATTDTLTNKTISGASNTLSAIPVTALSTTGTASSSTYLSGTGAWGSPGTPPFSDATSILENSSDTTKQLKLSLAGLTTGTTQALNVPNTSGVLNSEQFCILTSGYTLTNTTSSQKLFNSTTNGALTLSVGIYFFECLFNIQFMSTSSGTFSFGLIGTGTATVGNILYNYITFKSNSTPVAATTGAVGLGTTNPIVTPSAEAVPGGAVCSGSLQITGAGTIIPSTALSVATAAAIVQPGSYFRIWQVSSTSTTATVGAWS